jgi:hypothetical protein
MKVKHFSDFCNGCNLIASVTLTSVYVDCPESCAQKKNRSFANGLF